MNATRRSIQLGSTGIEVGAIGFGAMNLSIEDRPDEAVSRAVLEAALDAGADFIDTADVYCLDDADLGHNERLIGSVLRRRPDRNSIRVATKIGLTRPNGEWQVDGSPKHLRAACERSLKALAVDRILLCQLHAPDPSASFEKSVETLAQLREEARIEHVGLSNVNISQIRRASRIVEIVSVQNRLNPWFREAIDDGVMGECDARGITFLAYSPLGGPRLSTKLASHRTLLQIAEKHACSPWALVIEWVRRQGSKVLPIPGARTAEHAIDNMSVMTLDLSDAEITAIGRAKYSRV